MTLEILFVGAGLLLVLAGIFGGGFEVQQIKVPVLGGTVRVIAFAVGALLLLMAIGFHVEPADPARRIVSSLNDGPATRGSSAIRFVIFDTLGPEQIASGQAEQASISIDGTPNGTLTANAVASLTRISGIGASTSRSAPITNIVMPPIASTP